MDKRAAEDKAILSEIDANIEAHRLYVNQIKKQLEREKTRLMDLETQRLVVLALQNARGDA